MKQLFLGMLLTCLLFGTFVVQEATAQDRGKDLFNQTCVACHTIGGGRIVGPDLANVHVRREEAWILNFVKSPQSFANSGNADAVELLAEFNGLVMPDQTLSDDDIRAIVGFIARTSPVETVVDNSPIEEPSAEDLAGESIAHGLDLFVGNVRFKNGSAACNACHTVDTDATMTGGSLAKNLTDAVTRLTRNGVDAMMANPPFPPMRAAFADKPLTEDERVAIIDFLQASGETLSEADSEIIPINHRTKLIAFGLVGLALLMGLFFLLGLRGSKKSVNQDIYDRQIRST